MLRQVGTSHFTSEELEVLAGMLVRAFEGDPTLRYVFPDDTDWSQLGRRYFRLLLNEQMKTATGTVERDLRSVALWECPARVPNVFDWLSRLVRTMWTLRHNLGRARQITTMTAPYRPQRPVLYLTYLATDPVHQGGGFASRLLDNLFEHSGQTGLPVFLECSNADNVGFYQRHGFRVRHEVRIDGGPTIWPMLREPTLREPVVTMP